MSLGSEVEGKGAAAGFELGQGQGPKLEELGGGGPPSPARGGPPSVVGARVSFFCNTNLKDDPRALEYADDYKKYGRCEFTTTVNQDKECYNRQCICVHGDTFRVGELKEEPKRRFVISRDEMLDIIYPGPGLALDQIKARILRETGDNFETKVEFHGCLRHVQRIPWKFVQEMSDFKEHLTIEFESKMFELSKTNAGMSKAQKEELVKMVLEIRALMNLMRNAELTTILETQSQIVDAIAKATVEGTSPNYAEIQDALTRAREDVLEVTTGGGTHNVRKSAKRSRT